MIDLHTHSTVSDGTESPTRLVATAHAAGITTLAITDHDTTAGWDEAARALPAGMRLVRGAEFSTQSDDGRGGTVSTHLLGYLFDPGHRAIVAEQERLRDERRRRVLGMAEKLHGTAWAVDGEALLAALPADSPAGRPHLGRALIEQGAVGSMQEAFDGPLRKDGPFYVEKRNTDVVAAIGMIVEAGGVAVFAHPLARRKGPTVELSVIRDLAGRGLAGVEVDHPDHAPADREALRALAGALGLLVTGSSDYHGTNKTTPIAAETTDPAVLDALVDRARGVPVVTGGGGP